MNYQVDIKDEYRKAKSKLFRYSLLVSGVLLVAIVADVLLVLLAGENFRANFVIASVVTILLAWFLIFFFSSLYGDVNSRYRYFRSYDSGEKPVEEVEFLGKSEELCFINGLYVYPLYVRYSIGLNVQDKVIFTLDNNLDYEMGDKLTIETYQRILMKAEKHA